MECSLEMLKKKKNFNLSIEAESDGRKSGFQSDSCAVNRTSTELIGGKEKQNK